MFDLPMMYYLDFLQKKNIDLEQYKSDRSSKKSSRSRQNQQDFNGNFGDMFNKIYEENKIEDENE